MKILGIDPGLRITGFGVIEKAGKKMTYIASGVIKTQTAAHANDLPQRIKTIYQGVAQIINTYQPDCAAIEKVFVNVNPQSTLLLGQARGAALSALVCHDLSVAEYTALQIKQAAVGYGRATKSQMQQMMQRLLCLPHVVSSDASDALAVAVAHAHAENFVSNLSQLTQKIGSKNLRVKNGRLVD